MPAGKTPFAPVSSGWDIGDGGPRRFGELFARGGSAAEVFGHPVAGASVEVWVD